jgi:hypothetical protein
MSRLITIACLCAATVLQAGICVAQQDSSPPVLGDIHEFRTRERFQQYAMAAKKFMVEHPDSPDAPRVTFDLMLLLSVTDNTAAALELKQVLLMRYTFSPYAVYVIRSFDTAEHCREFLQTFYRKWVLTHPDKAVLTMFDMGVSYGFAKFGDELLSDEDFLLQCAFADHEVTTKPSRFSVQIRQKIKAADEKTQRIAAILMNKDASPAERFLALRPFSERSGVRQILPYLQAGMTAAEKNSGAVQLAVAKTYLRDGKLAEAYPILKGLQNEDSDVQLVTWTAWAAAASGRKDTALQLLGGIKSDASDPAHESARQLAATLPEHEAALKTHAAALLAISQQFLKEDQALEISGRFVPDEGAPVAFYLAYDEATRFADAVIRKNDLVMAVRIDGDQSSVLFPGEDVQHVYASGASLPQPKFELSQTAEGVFSFKFNTAINNEEQATQGTVRSLFASPTLSTQAGVQALLSAGIKRGSFPEVINDADTGDQLLRWISLQIESPRPQITELRVSSDGRLTALRIDQLFIERIQYGKRGSFEFAPPQLPKRPVQHHETAPVSTMFRLFGAVTTLLVSGG